MRVAFDLTAVPRQITGAGVYITELAAALRRGGAVDLDEVRGGGSMLANRPVRLAWEQTALPWRLRRRQPDLLHSPHYTMPLLSPVPVVVTFHDATFFTHPELHERVKVVFFRAAMRAAARRAARVIAVSAATRDGVVAHTRVDPAKVDVVPEAVDHTRFHPPRHDEVERFRAKHGLDGPYIAFLGTIEPRKNVPRLIAAFGALDWDGILVVAGRDGWGPPLPDPLPPAVRRIGYIDGDERRALLGGAAAVCYPSLAEGFGLPVLEAMACGAPVVTSAVSSTAEVAGGCAVLVDPTDVGSIGAGLARALDSAVDTERARQRALVFTWDATALATVDVYHSALSHTTERP